MAARRSGKGSKAAVSAGGTEPLDEGGSDRDEGSGGDGDEPEEEEADAGLGPVDPPVRGTRRSRAAVPPDDYDEDEGVAKPKLESHAEAERAKLLQAEESKAALQAHDALVAKHQQRGAKPSVQALSKEIERARQRVRQKNMVHRKPGFYTAQPLTTTDEEGNRLQCPPGMRLPDVIVAAMKKRRDLRRLVEAGVIDDLR